MSGDVLQNYTEEVRALLTERMRIKGRSLSHQVGQLGRRVPKAVRRDAEYLAKAETLMQHPKLSLMVNDAQVARAGRNVVDHLQTIDPREIAKDKLLRGLAKVAGFVIILFVGLVWFAWDRGLV